MAIDILQTLDIIEAMENFIARKRPPENIRRQVDLAYKIKNQSIIIFEIRPQWNKPEKTMESNIAKTTFIKTKNYWKVFWFRADLKWHSYQPQSTVMSLKDFIKLVEEDNHHCFWG